LRLATVRPGVSLPTPESPPFYRVESLPSVAPAAAHPGITSRHPAVTAPTPLRIASIHPPAIPLPAVPQVSVTSGADIAPAYVPWAQRRANSLRVKSVPGSPHIGPHVVAFATTHKRGTIIVHVKEKKLYLIETPATARVYPIGTALGALDILGRTRVTTRRFMPTWTPTPSQRRRDPTLPRRVKAGPLNPLGIRALGLGWRYRVIHGTADPSSIGFARSDGCIRMLNDDVADLFERVRVGNRVIVLASANATLVETRPPGYEEYKPRRKRWRRGAGRKKHRASRGYASRKKKRQRKRKR